MLLLLDLLLIVVDVVLFLLRRPSLPLRLVIALLVLRHLRACVCVRMDGVRFVSSQGLPNLCLELVAIYRNFLELDVLASA